MEDPPPLGQVNQVNRVAAPAPRPFLRRRVPPSSDTYGGVSGMMLATSGSGLRRIDSAATISSEGADVEVMGDPYGRGLSLGDKIRTLIWVHKQRLLGRYKWGERYMDSCPCRPCSPGTLVYARTLAEFGPTPLLNCQLTLLGLSRFIPRSSSFDLNLTSEEEEEVPLDAATSYLFEQFRDQPFAAAAYLRAILYCWAGGVVLLLQHATSAVLGSDSFPERIAWQWLLCQLVVQLLQLCPRLRLYRRLVDITHSRDNEEANIRIRRLFGAPFWRRSQALSLVFYALVFMGPVLVFSMDPASPVRREVLSICCANLFIIVLRVALTFAIIHTIMEAREADNESGSPAVRGLSAQSISRLHSYEFRTASHAEDVEPSVFDCSICLGDFQDSDEIMHLPCDERHAFHAGCITRWLLKSSSCPLCQRVVEESSAQ